MSENKFIQHLKGKDTAKSVLEIKNQATPTIFANMPTGSSDGSVVYSDHRGNATAVLQGADNWKLSGATLVSATTVYGDGRDLIGSFLVSGNTLWVNATYTFASAKVFTPNTKWVLKLCGHSLDSATYNDVPFSLVIKIGNSIITKQFNIREEAFEFCKELVIDFAESETATLHANAGDTMSVQVLCGDATASATIYNGMTVLTALQRRVDGNAVAAASYTFEELETEVINLINYVDDTFLPLAGGTMTGDLAFQYSTSYPKLRIIQSGQNTNHLRFINNSYANQSVSFDLSQAAIHPLVTGRGHVGTSDIHFGDAYIDKIYTPKINNGYDISVPVTVSADSFALESEITDINSKIPAQASSSNQLADKSFVNSSIATNTANFIGTFNSVADLEAYSGTVTNNDYAFVIGTDGDGNTVYNRYKYTTATTPASWVFEYALNNSSFTANQWASINSGVTSSDVTLARSAVQPSDVGNGTITLTQGGTTKGTFTTNQSGNTTIDLDAGGAGGCSLFDWKWADHELDDTSWLRADTFSWQDGSVYEAAYQHLADDYNALVTSKQRLNVPGHTLFRNESLDVLGESHPYAYSTRDQTTFVAYTDVLAEPGVSLSAYDGPTSSASSMVANPIGPSDIAFYNKETIAGTTIKYYLAADGHKICLPDQESNVATIYNATGVAWYYVLDETNQRFKLPRSKHNKYAATLGVVGNGMTLGLTDGTKNAGVFTAASAPNSLTSATNDYGKNVGTTVTGGRLTTDKMVGITTDASKSGIIAQQEQDTDQYKYLYFYVGNFTQTALENTAGLNAELFNGKVDLDADNLSATGKETVAHQAMPSSRYDSLTVGASGSTYTAPADGWFYISAKTSGTNYQVIMDAGCMSVSFRASSLNQRMILPVSKGMVMTLNYDGTLSNTTFRFVYANGAQ